jgi:hypothetical protein
MQHSTPHPEVHHSERITLTNETELERARLQCLATPDDSDAEDDVLSQLASEMRVRFARKDFTGSLELAESITAVREDDVEAKACAGVCRARLVASYVALMGALEQVPVLAMPLIEIDGSQLDHRAGFILSQVDGKTTLEAILDVSGMASHDALRIVWELVQRGVLAFGGACAPPKKLKRWRKREES